MMGIFATVALIIIFAASGLGAAFLCAWLFELNDRRRRKRDFMEKQLREFYAPLLSIRTRVEAFGGWEEGSDLWKSELLPFYSEMLQVFREKFWLAEDSTRERFQKLIAYTELWERGLNRRIPVEVIAWFNVRPAELVPLYEDLEQTFQNLRSKLT